MNEREVKVKLGRMTTDELAEGHMQILHRIEKVIQLPCFSPRQKQAVIENLDLAKSNVAMSLIAYELADDDEERRKLHQLDTKFFWASAKFYKEMLDCARSAGFSPVEVF